MSASEMSRSPMTSRELLQYIRELQGETILWLLIPAYLGAAGLLAIAPRFEEPLQTSLAALILLLLPVLMLAVRARSYLGSVWVLVLGSLVVSFSLAWGGRVLVATYLLPLAVGLAALFVSIPGGGLVAAVCTAGLLGWPSVTPLARSSEPLAAVAGVWGTLGLIWLTRQPFLTALEWYGTTYEAHRRLLEDARETQMQLRQALEYLAEANSQLTGVNQLNHRLRQAAEDVRAAKERFVANVSHELRTPLNMIVGFSEMIMQAPGAYGGRLPARLLADLEVIHRNGRHLSHLIDDVLDLSQVEANQMALARDYEALQDIIAAALTAVRPLYESKGLYLQADVPADLPPVFCDGTRIRQVVLNLLSNAGRFTEEGGVRVRAWSTEDHVSVSIADTGPGISSSAGKDLFQPFHQLDSTSHNRRGGTGLGLSISRSFVELHGGKIWFESGEGYGTTFFFRLPIDVPSSGEWNVGRWFSPYQSCEERVRPSRSMQADIRPRVVVMDPGCSLERLLSRYLNGMQVAGVRSAAEARAELARFPATALIVNEPTDRVSLEDMVETYELPVGTLMVVCPIPGTANIADGMSVTDYLVKPVSRDVLLTAIGRLGRKVGTLLVVDDEPDALRLFRRIIMSSGRSYQVVTARDAQEALAALRQLRPDALLLDLVMPNVDGFHVLAEKNKEPALRDIPVIVISARDPAGHPIVSSGLSVTLRGGLSVPQLLSSITALTQTLVGPARGVGLVPQGIAPG